MDIFEALAEPRRRNIVEMLATKGQLTATAISDKFNVSAPAISQHLKVLRETGLVDMEKQGRERIYRVNPSAFTQLEKWARQLSQVWDQRFNRLDQILNKEKRKWQKK